MISSWIRDRLASSGLVLSALLATLVVGVTTWESRSFVGDDLEVLNAMKNGTYLVSWTDALRDTSLDKWRPLNNLYLFFTLRALGNSYQTYWLVNSLLMATLSVVLTWAIFRLTKIESAHHRKMVGIAVAALAVSPLTFMFRIGVFGFLEVAPALCVLIAYVLLNKPESVHALPLSATALLGAVLIHERYVVLGFLFGLFALLRSRHDPRYHASVYYFFGIPLLWIYTTTLVLDMNPLRGGGEQELSDTAGSWIIGRFFDAILFLVGGTSGKTVFYSSPQGLIGEITDPSGPLSIPIRVWSMILWGIFSILFALVRFRRGKEFEVHLTTSTSLVDTRRIAGETLLCALVLLVPAASVSSRIEGRWLFVSLMFLVIAFVASSRELTKVGRSQASISMFTALTLLGVINLVGLRSFNDFNFFRTNTYSLIEFADNESQDLSTEEFSIMIFLQENTSYLAWSTNGGAALTEYMQFKPMNVGFVFPPAKASASQCWYRFRQKCLNIVAESPGISEPVAFYLIE